MSLNIDSDPSTAGHCYRCSVSLRMTLI